MNNHKPHPEAISSPTFCPNPNNLGQEITIARQPDGTYACLCSHSGSCHLMPRAVATASTAAQTELTPSPMRFTRLPSFT